MRGAAGSGSSQRGSQQHPGGIQRGRQGCGQGGQPRGAATGQASRPKRCLATSLTPPHRIPLPSCCPFPCPVPPLLQLCSTSSTPSARWWAAPRRSHACCCARPPPSPCAHASSCWESTSSTASELAGGAWEGQGRAAWSLGPASPAVPLGTALACCTGWLRLACG